MTPGQAHYNVFGRVILSNYPFSRAKGVRACRTHLDGEQGLAGEARADHQLGRQRDKLQGHIPLPQAGPANMSMSSAEEFSNREWKNP
jgi:hypothetical protein